MDILDELFRERYDDLYDYTRKAIRYFRREYEPEMIINESYIWARNKTYRDDITSGELEGDIKKFIKNSIKWSRSKFNFKKKVNRTMTIDYCYSITDEDTFTDEDFIKSIVEEYLDTLTRIERRLFDMYYYRGLDTINKIRIHLGISYASASQTKKECERIYSGLRDFVNEKIKEDI